MRTPSIAIIGAGFSGIGMAVKLRKEGITSFTIYERLPDAGGCWRSNAFPGAEVDTESDVYRYSFKPYPWSRSHARREELLTYFDEVIDEYGLRERIRFGVSIESIEWTRADGYQLTTGSGSTIRADVVISAVGLFSEPQIPAWPGLDRFTGDVVHTAEWREELDLSEKKVAVVGTGSTSASLVPAIAGQVDQLYVFQRQPGWILPKPVTRFADDERLRRARPSAAQWNRLKALYRIRRAIKGGRAKKIGTAQNRAVQRVAENFLRKSFADRPDLLAALTPDYPVYGKRLVRSSDFYPALKRPNVTLVPRGITEVRESSVVDEAGAEHQVDTILLATGFKAAQFLSGIRITGRDRTELQDFWQADASAFLGLMVPKFPNFFILYGPNTNGSGAHLFVLECQMAFVAGVVKRMARTRSTVAEVRAGHFRAYEQWLSKQWEDSALLSTHNYFRGATGNVVTNWPRGFGLYYLLTRIGRARSVRFSRTAPTLQRLTPTADSRSTSSGR
ncbi:NAD(P)/FAD-dependent oxidoreductase [Kribbella sp. NBC_00709]|uniref:flavin-containing monooxygenase n=1 Tax=Kribbella sp. NBC_00709 TaxID=2975972 RepID=UPI002E2838C4|nr:NAD(P)/FAD-dependent oxidoreductase [Kribbella sp. NBC_00709]